MTTQQVATYLVTLAYISNPHSCIQSFTNHIDALTISGETNIWFIQVFAQLLMYLNTNKLFRYTVNDF